MDTHDDNGQGARLARAFMRHWLPIKERKKKLALEEAFETIRRQAIKCEREGYYASLVILNIALYFLLAERDIQCIKIDALTHRNQWKRRLCARVVLLTLHEWDMDKVSGNGLKSALETIQASEEVRKEAIEALRLVRVAQRRARKEFSLLRNATIGHRDPNALFQCHAIENINIQQVFSIVGDFYKAAGRFIDLLPRMMLESSTFPALLQQIRGPANQERLPNTRRGAQ